MKQGNGGRPKISVIVPCQNSYQHLRQILDSLRAQTFQDFEKILVNDGSDDPDSISFNDSLADNLCVLRQHNMGIPAARNSGVLQAWGDYVLPLDCDDWLDSGFMEKACDRI